MKKYIKQLLIIIVLILLILFAVLIIHRKKQKLAHAPKYGMNPIPVRVVKSRSGSLSDKINYLATIEPMQVANISARLISTVDKILCDEGSSVKIGSTLIELDKQEIKDSQSSIQANIAQARSEFAANNAAVSSLKKTVSFLQREAKRNKTLADKGSIPGSQAEASMDKASEFAGKLEAAEYKLQSLSHSIEALQSKKNQIKTRLSYCTIKSPYNGIVQQRLVDTGDMAAPGKKLLVIEDRSQLKLSFDIPQQDLAKIKQAMPVYFTVNGKTRQAALSLLYPSLNKTKMMHAEAFLNTKLSEGLICGQYLTVQVKVNKAVNAVILPISCLIEGPDHNQYVFAVENNKLTHHKIKILASNADEIAVDGIKADQQIVLNTFLGWNTLSANQKVQVLK